MAFSATPLARRDSLVAHIFNGFQPSKMAALLLPRSMEDSKYTFGTSSQAALRLEEIAGYFNPLAADLVQRFVSDPRDVALDIGCGPGFTTNMLSQAAGCGRTYGLDRSREFLERATRRFPHCTFLEHDVTRCPFPVTADVMYARFVLCHLREPLSLIEGWITQLNAAGLLFVDEIDGITTHLEAFKTYLAMAEGMVAAQGASLYVGETLESAGYTAEALLNEPLLLRVGNRQAASWFLPNTETVWNENEYVRSALSRQEREAINRELHRLKTTTDSRSDIAWKLRRVVLRKRVN